MSERKITAEAVRAESALRRLDKAAAESIEACRGRWAQKRADLIGELPEDVRRMLVAGGVIELREEAKT